MKRTDDVLEPQRSAASTAALVTSLVAGQAQIAALAQKFSTVRCAREKVFYLDPGRLGARR